MSSRKKSPPKQSRLERLLPSDEGDMEADTSTKSTASRRASVMSSRSILETVDPSLKKTRTEEEMYALSVYFNHIINLLLAVGIDSIQDQGKEVTKAAIVLQAKGYTPPIIFPPQMPGSDALNNDQVNVLIQNLQEARVNVPQLMKTLQGCASGVSRRPKPKRRVSIGTLSERGAETKSRKERDKNYSRRKSSDHFERTGRKPPSLIGDTWVRGRTTPDRSLSGDSAALTDKFGDFPEESRLGGSERSAVAEPASEPEPAPGPEPAPEPAPEPESSGSGMFDAFFGAPTPAPEASPETETGGMFSGFIGTPAPAPDVEDKPATQANDDKEQTADESSINPMDAKAGTKTETGSVSSGSGKMSSSRNSISSMGSSRSRLNAPARPGKYSRRLSEEVPVATVSRRPKRTESEFTLKEDPFRIDFLKINEESEKTQRMRGSSKKEEVKKWWSSIKRWEILVALGLVVMIVAAILFNHFNYGTSDGAEASKSGSALQAHMDGHFRDGASVIPSHIKITPDATSKMSELTQKVRSRDQKLSELESLIVQHGISKADDFHWNSFHYDYDEFVVMSPQTKALIWLASQDMLHVSTEERDIQHHKLFQRYALAVLFYATHDGGHSNGMIETVDTGFFPTAQLLRMQHESSWIHNNGWLTDETICTWYGVHCADDATNDEVVTAVNLSHNGLHGTLPVHELTVILRSELLELDLSGNDLSGTIGLVATDSKEWFSWPRLRYLHLQDNRLTGNIPIHWLLGCPALEEINLSGNQFSGTLPDHAFELLDNLKRLQLDHNSFWGTVPVLGHLQKLEQLDLQNNSFSGTFPLGLFMLTALVELRAGDNHFTGSLSADLVNMMNLEILSVENNSLSGHLPDVFHTMTNLIQLLLRGNSFSGQLPESLGEMEKLEALALDNNSFTGSVSSELAGLTNLKSLLLFHNNLLGDIPEGVCGLKEGFFHFKKLHHIAADCLAKVDCACCDECY